MGKVFVKKYGFCIGGWLLVGRNVGLVAIIVGFLSFESSVFSR